MIREYRLEDIPKIAELQRDLNNYHRNIDDEYYQPSKNAVREFSYYIKKRFNDQKFKIYVAQEDTEIIGYIMGWIDIRPPIYAKRKIGYLSNIYILPNKRGRSVGTKLETTLKEWFVSKNVDFIETKADARNLATINSFRSLGFSEQSITFIKKL